MVIAMKKDIMSTFISRLSPSTATLVKNELGASLDPSSIGLPCFGVSLTEHVPAPFEANFPFGLLTKFNYPWVADRISGRVRHRSDCDAWILVDSETGVLRAEAM